MALSKSNAMKKCCVQIMLISFFKLIKRLTIVCLVCLSYLMVKFATGEGNILLTR